jgi:hypothetical protein
MMIVGGRGGVEGALCVDIGKGSAAAWGESDMTLPLNLRTNLGKQALETSRKAAMARNTLAIRSGVIRASGSEPLGPDPGSTTK